MADVETERCRTIWCAVIKQAVLDAIAPLARDPSRRLDQLNARAWFQNDSKDYREVCHLAGYEPDRIRKVVLPKIEDAKPHDKEPHNAKREPAHAE
jgi:hypothetical protein